MFDNDLPSSPVGWCNAWGRRMGINGNNQHGIPEGHDDDLDAFRHTFANALVVAYNVFDFAGVDKFIVWFFGVLNEVPRFFSHKCSREMDIYNNKIGRGLAPNNQQMKDWFEQGKDPIEEIAKIVAQAVKSGETINDLADSRMSGYCQVKYGKEGEAKEEIPIPAKPSKKEGAYIWRTKGDNKTRSSHALRDGKVYQWNNPPEGGHPGEDYGCRCVAEPYEESSSSEEILSNLFK